VIKTRLSKLDAQINAEQSFGQPSVWREVYKAMRCPGSPCDNKDGYCWQNPHRKKHYKLRTLLHLKQFVELVKRGLLELETRDDIPDEIREEVVASSSFCACIYLPVAFAVSIVQLLMVSFKSIIVMSTGYNSTCYSANQC
jgi:hypothetical protein